MLKNLKYSVIIPTMWMVPDMLLVMLQKYQDNSLIGEILIINNKLGFSLQRLQEYDKVRVLNGGKNFYVNPSWNLGVSESVCDKIIIANDDIYIENLDGVLKLVEANIHPGYIFGFGRNCFIQKRGVLPLGKPKISVPKKELVYGFGVFMLLYKSSYIKIPGPLKVWCGDSLLYNALTPFIIEGIDIRTKMGGTSRQLKLKQIKKEDKAYYRWLTKIYILD